MSIPLFPSRHFSTRKSASGFSLIELLVTATIIIILTTIGLVSYNQALQSSRNARRKADLEIVRQALILYKADNGYYPSTNYAGLSSGPAALGTGYIARLPTDPKAGYVYTYNPDNCTASKCQTFTLGATLEVGTNTPTLYEITNP
jgi:general secretion pathway protein G